MLLDIFFEPSFQIQDYVRCELEIGELSELELFQLLVAVLRDRHYPCQGIKTSQKEGTGKISFQKVS
jgi:hypothetical protein